MKGVHIWDDGQAIFIHKDEMKEKFITLIISGPEENVLQL